MTGTDDREGMDMADKCGSDDNEIEEPFVSHFPLSWVVFVWIFPPHKIAKYKVIGSNTLTYKKEPYTLDNA